MTNEGSKSGTLPAVMSKCQSTVQANVRIRVVGIWIFLRDTGESFFDEKSFFFPLFLYTALLTQHNPTINRA
jgi:hypothetical protein